MPLGFDSISELEIHRGYFGRPLSILAYESQSRIPRAVTENLPPRHARNQFTACIQKMVARILIAFASGKFFTNRLGTVFAKSVDCLNSAVDYAASADFTRCTVDMPLRTILAVLRSDWRPFN